MDVSPTRDQRVDTQPGGGYCPTSLFSGLGSPDFVEYTVFLGFQRLGRIFRQPLSNRSLPHSATRCIPKRLGRLSTEVMVPCTSAGNKAPDAPNEGWSIVCEPTESKKSSPTMARWSCGLCHFAPGKLWKLLFCPVRTRQVKSLPFL